VATADCYDDIPVRLILSRENQSSIINLSIHALIDGYYYLQFLLTAVPHETSLLVRGIRRLVLELHMSFAAAATGRLGIVGLTLDIAFPPVYVAER
jgi:hypothetical protein